MLEKLEYFPLAIAIGNIVFKNLLGGETKIADIIAIIISAFNFIIPSSVINRWIFKVNLDDNLS